METVPSPFKPTDGFHDCYLRASSEQRSFVVEVRNLHLDIDVVEKPLKHG